MQPLYAYAYDIWIIMSVYYIYVHNIYKYTFIYLFIRTLHHPYIKVPHKLPDSFFVFLMLDVKMSALATFTLLPSLLIIIIIFLK